MGQEKYVIQFDWRNMRGHYPFCANCKGNNFKDGICHNCTIADQYSFQQNWSTNSFIKFLFKFVVISLKYGIVDVQYRNCNE